jgi:2'-5' RNA ligase
MSRLFFALWPDESVRAGMVSVMDQLPGDCGRFVRYSNLHITLVFLGSVSEKQEQCILSGARHLKMPPVTLTLGTLGWWQRPQVLWLASQKVPDALVNLADKLRDVAGQCGIKTDERPFTPHATLARKVRKRVVLPEITPLQWEVRDFCLVRSDTRAEGPSYQVLWTSTN